MPIDFQLDRWQKIRADYGAWWKGELDRPLIYVTLGGADPGRPEPDVPGVAFTSFHPDSVTPEAIVDRWDWELSHQRYIGDAFPAVWPNFGAGVAAAFLGAELQNRQETVWFHPRESVMPPDLKLRYDPDNRWLRRVSDIARAAQERWQGLVQVGMTDLGGAYDVLSTFRPSADLLLDLYDYPEDIKRLGWEMHELWWRYFDELDAAMQPTNPGYTCWTPIYSETPYYMLQCDFCYMVGPKTFDEFILPELAASCRRLDNAFYHLDGPGELPHLDSLLSIPELKGIQWVPGDGQPGIDEWPDVYRRVHEAGKLIQISAGQSPLGLEVIDVIADQIGTAKGIMHFAGGHLEDEDRIMKFLEGYGVV